MIIFVGDRPSKDNIDPVIAFVGTKSYKTLLGWIADMDIDIRNVDLINKNQVTEYPFMYFDRIIVLGDAAEKEVKKIYTKSKYFKLPHPSGLNRKLNDKKWLNKQLKACKKWLGERCQ
jgi:hypothetical protein